MICPHCNKETDSYTVYSHNTNLNGCAGGVLNYILTVANAGVANPLPLAESGNLIINAASGCANQQLGHYHVI